MLKGRHFKALLLAAGLGAGLIATGCAGSGIDGGNLPGEVKNEDGANTDANPNAPIAQQTFLVANRNSTAPYQNTLTTQTNMTIDTPPRVAATGPAGSVALSTQVSNTTDPLFGRLNSTATAPVFTGGGGQGTNWVAVTPKPQPSVGLTSYYIYTVNGLQTFPQQVPAPTPAGAPTPAPSPVPIFNPQYIGDDSLSIGQIDVTNVATFQPPLPANISFSTPPLANIVPTLVQYPTDTRFYANYVHPTLKFMYATVRDGVLTYRLEANGAVTELARTSTGAGTRKAKAIAFSPNGNFMYVTCDSGHVAGFAITPQTGGLTPVPGSPYVTDTARADISGSGNITVNSLGVSFDRSGKFLYVVNQGVQTISGYSFNETTGALTPLPNFPLAAPQIAGGAVAFPAFILNHPTKDVLYMTNMGPNAPVSRTFGNGLQRPPYDIPSPAYPPTVFTSDPNSGQLAVLSSNTLVNGANRNSLNLAIDAAGRNLYITNAADPPAYDLFNQPAELRGAFTGGVTAFRINNDGSLTGELTSLESAGGDPNGILPLVIRNFAQ